MFYKIALGLCLFLLIFTSFTGPVLAGEIVISGNGSDTVSEASANVTTNTTVTQNNDANVTNSVATNATTGNNSADSNSGQVSITTGNVNTAVNITNNVNNSTVDLGCCNNQTINMTITGNGNNSTNNISTNIQSNINVNVSQVANVNNFVTGYANTGGNSASQNNGNISIDTGNIFISNNILNNLNNSKVTAPGGLNSNFVTKISGNGANSNNTISFSQINNFKTYVNNLANLNNVLNWTANTGDNVADKNQGDVNIQTGDIKIAVNIDNKVNTSEVKVACCRQEVQVSPPSDGGTTPGCENNCATSSPSPSGGTGPSNGSSGPGGGEVSGATGQILPATGTNWIITLTLVSLLMFLLGMYLRLHPGQDPGIKVIKA